MAQKRIILDGAVAATHVAYALSEVATIYPISPIAEMGEVADQWSCQGKKNVFGSPMQVKELESELGAAGACHGAAAAGALATTFTNSQGLLLMIPNMYKMAGNLLPVVIHVGARTVATHALSIFGDHSDVMAVRATGFSILASCSVQEAHDMAIVAHLSAIDSSVPMLHFFDAYRTANDMHTLNVCDYEDIAALVDKDKVKAFRARAMNPEHSNERGTAQNPDVFFQAREACNPYYDAVPGIVKKNLEAVGRLTGRQYHIFDYYGDPEAEYVTVSMASSSDVMRGAVEYLNARGYKVGHVNVRLYRPFSVQDFVDAIPATVKVVAALDRDKEPGAVGEPLYTDVCAALFQAGRMVKVIGGRYGLSSKDFNVSMAKAIFDEMAKPSPKPKFTIGINDDVTHLSLDYNNTIDPEAGKSHQVIFYGIGNDGTVGATKQIASILSEGTDIDVQAHFQYSAKKSFGYTISQLRMAKDLAPAPYDIVTADYVGCNTSLYVGRYALLDNIKDGGVFVLNSPWSTAQLNEKIPASMQRLIASRHVQFFNINAYAIAQKHGLGPHINTIMEALFFKITAIMPQDQVLAAMKQAVEQMYGHEGQIVVEANYAAIEEAFATDAEVKYPASWATASTAAEDAARQAYLATLPEWVAKIAVPMNELKGDSLPVSLMSADGVWPSGESAYEKRRIATFVPAWDAQKCIECVECSFVCSHAAIRPFVATDAELAGAPATFVTKDAWAKPLQGMKWRIQTYAEDCTGCASCATVCPAGALTMTPIEQELNAQIANLDFAQKHISSKAGLLPRFSILGSQLYQPLMEFSGACGGCGETPYIKLLTQLFGEHSIIANATGCSSVWGGDAPSTVYCRNSDGLGPAWGNSLFEDNAEYAYGIAVGINHRRSALTEVISQAINDPSTLPALRDALKSWQQVKDDCEKSYAAGLEIKKIIKENPTAKYVDAISADADLLGKKSVWAVGGDGWAYDIGFAGLDHVLASGIDINMLVLDTQCYSNTGGQASKATPYGAVAKFAYDGKREYHKNLGQMMMTYRNVYVASVAIGGNMNQVVKAFEEAAAYPGPSIIIAYCPCLMHGIKQSLSHSIIQERLGVQSNFWPIYRFSPTASENPLTFDEPYNYPQAADLPSPPQWSPKPWVKENIIAFGPSAPRNGADNSLVVDSGIDAPIAITPIVENETRFTMLSSHTSAEIAQEIFDRLQSASRDNVSRLKKL